MKPKLTNSKRNLQYQIKINPSPSKNYGSANTLDIISRKEFVEDLPDNLKNMVRGVDIDLINEAIGAIKAGHAKINGLKPKTRLEKYIVISSYFKIGRTNLNMPFDGAKNIKKNYIVSIGYKDSSYTITFPENSTDS